MSTNNSMISLKLTKITQWWHLNKKVAMPNKKTQNGKMSTLRMLMRLKSKTKRKK